MAWTDLTWDKQLEGILWFIGIGVMCVLFANFVRKYRRTETKARTFFLGLCMFAGGYMVARIVENIRKYFLFTTPNEIVNAWLNNTQIDGFNWTLRIVYYVISWVCIAIFYANLERFVFQNKTKFILTITAAVEGIVSIGLYCVLPSSVEFQVFMGIATAGFFICCFFPVLLFLNVGRKAVGAVRWNSVLAAIGLLVLVLGVMADLPETGYISAVNGGFVPEIMMGIAAPILLVAGFCMVSVAFLRMYAD